MQTHTRKGALGWSEMSLKRLYVQAWSPTCDPTRGVEPLGGAQWEEVGHWECVLEGVTEILAPSWFFVSLPRGQEISNFDPPGTPHHSPLHTTTGPKAMSNQTITDWTLPNHESK
jgi:hypothetical protein